MRLVLAVVFLLLVGVFGGLAVAYYSTPGDILLANEVVLRVRSGAGGLSVEERVGLIWERVIEAMTELSMAENIRVEKKGNLLVVCIVKKGVVTVDAATAKANHTTPEKLAEVWVKHIQEFFPLGVPLWNYVRIN